VNPDRLDAAWRELHTPDDQSHLEATPLEAKGIWAAIDYEGHRHLLLRVPDGTDAPSTQTRGLHVAAARHQVRGEEPADYLDLACVSGDLTITFTAVAADIAAGAGPLAPADRVAAVVDALGRWQWFWGVDPDRLSAQDALGLFAELWFLQRWAGGDAAAVHAWSASLGSRHDFQWPSSSVEVKAAARRGDGAVLHRIQHLDQLTDPEQGELFLFSLRVVRDELAHNSLPQLVDHVSDALDGDPQTWDEFAHKVGDRGYSPAYRRRHETPYRILGEALYRVGEGFPRLTTDSFVGGLSGAIADVSYVLDMAACDEWVAATSPDAWER
jgi:hypothetical protein